MANETKIINESNSLISVLVTDDVVELFELFLKSNHPRSQKKEEIGEEHQQILTPNTLTLITKVDLNYLQEK